MSSDKRKALDLFFEQVSPKILSTYDILQESWEIHEDRIATLEKGYLDTIEKLETIDKKIELANARRRKELLFLSIIVISTLSLIIDGYLKMSTIEPFYIIGSLFFLATISIPILRMILND